MGGTLNLNDITGQIQRYVQLLKDRKKTTPTGETSSFAEWSPLPSYNELRSNINRLDGSSKFSIHNMLENHTVLTSSSYAAEAYSHLSDLEDKNKVVLDFMHKNNRNFDVSA